MKTMKNLVGLKSISTLLIAFVLVLGSCNKTDETLSATERESLSAESFSDAEVDDANDMASIATGNVSLTQFNGGREDGRTEENGPVKPIFPWASLDDRLKCAAITIVRTNTAGTRPTGTITIDFDANAGCKDGRGNTRSGKIVIEYAGFRFMPESTIKTTFNNYTKNGVKVEGVHTLTNVATLNSFPRFLVTIVGGKLTFADGRTITREQSFTREWQRASSPASDKWVILKGSEASGKNKNDKTYTMKVTADLEYSRACAISDKVFIAVKGTKVFTTENKEFTVDYGSGACDNDITITVNGVSKTITVGAN
ncbi:MAG: hypothetical protein ACK47E_02510 [Cyclobacteriaceae bacterium]|jgi:hypothetical protein